MLSSRAVLESRYHKFGELYRNICPTQGLIHYLLCYNIRRVPICCVPCLGRLCLEDLLMGHAAQDYTSASDQRNASACGDGLRAELVNLFGLISISTNAPECCGGTTGIGTILLDFGKYIGRRYIYINIIWPDGVDPVTPHWPIRGLPMPLRVFV